MWNYVVTAHKPTAVTLSVTGAFTGPNELNLIISKVSRLEIYLLTEKGLQLLLDVGIYGRISHLELYRPPNSKQDWLLVLVEKYKFCILSFDVNEQKIVTEANGDIADRIGRPRDMGQIAAIDPNRRMIGMHFYDGLYKVIPMDPQTGGIFDAFNLRLVDAQIIDIKFLSGCPQPTIAVLHSDPQRAKHLKTYVISISEKTMRLGPYAQTNIDSTSSILIAPPAPLGGVLVVSDQTITYHHCQSKDPAPSSIPIKATIITAYGRIDQNGSRYLLGDCNGILYLLILSHQESKLKEIKFEYLGETSRASTISYLDNGFVFIGSMLGDSQLIKLSQEKVKFSSGDVTMTSKEQESFIQVIERYSNLGPILDLCVVDLDRQGQGQIVTCSGAFKDSTIRVVRNGIGLNELATIDLPTIKGLWALKGNKGDFDEFLCVTFIGDTRFLSIVGEEVEDLDIPAFYSDDQTLHCANVVGGNIIQVTSGGIRLVSTSSRELVYEWKESENNEKINSVSCNQTQLIITTGGKTLRYLDITPTAITQVKKLVLDNEISCVTVSNLKAENSKSQFCAVGLWNFNLLIFTLPSLELVITEPLSGHIIPRSLLFTSFEGNAYFFCGLGDGHLVHYTLNIHQETNKLTLCDRRHVTLGTQPILLTTFTVNNLTYIFASSDRPTIIYYQNYKILYSNVNLREVNYVSGFNTESFRSSLAVANETTLTIGTIDNIQKLHIKSVSLNSSSSAVQLQSEPVRRLCHQRSSSTFMVLSYQVSEAGEKSVLRLLDDQTFEVTSSYALDESEMGYSMETCTFNSESQEYYVIGTAILSTDDPEPREGRILIFSAENKQLSLVCQTSINGCALCLNPFNGKLLAGVNNQIQLFKMSDIENKGKELSLETYKGGHTMILGIVSRGDFILVGDMIKSVILYTYKSESGKLEEAARDLEPSWLTQLAILDDDTYLQSDASFNLLTLRRNTDATTEEERMKLQIVGRFHNGEMINKIRKGSLVMRLGDAGQISTYLFGTVNGMIGVIAQLTQEQYQFFEKLQQNLSRVIKGVGGFKNSDWRSFLTDRKTELASNFIDGDLIEQFLDLPPEKMREAVRDLPFTVDEVSRRIETMIQATH